MKNLFLPLDFIKKHPLAFVSLILMFTVLCHLSTLPISPLVWGDDATITEEGRLQLFPSSTDDSILLFKKDMAAKIYHVLGPSICELGFRMTGSFLAPRIFALAGFVAATLLLFFYLRSRTHHLSATLIAVLLFMSNHDVILSFRSPRLDCWAFVCCLLSLICLDYAQKTALPYFKVYLLWFLSGVSAAIGFFIWNASALLYPMIGILGLEHMLCDKNILSSIRKLAIAVIGFLGVFILIALFFDLLHNDSGKSRALFFELLWGTFHGNSIALLACVLKTPLSSLLIFSLLIYGLLRKNLLSIGICCTLVFVLLTQLYVFRFLYLEFMAMIYVGILLPDFLKNKNHTLVCLFRGLAVLTIISSLLVMTVLRNIIPHFFTQVRSYPTLELAMNKSIGSGASVYTDTYQVYYAGRNLDWKMYRYAPANPIPETEHKYDLLEICDFYITESLSPEMEVVLSAKGFSPFEVISFTPPEKFPRLQKLLARLNCPIGYGPYMIFKKNMSLLEIIKTPDCLRQSKQIRLLWFI